MSSLIATADDVLRLDLPQLGEALLVHLYSWKGEGKVWQPIGGINRQYFIAMMERRNVGLGPMPSNEPEFGTRQPEVTRRMLEAWNWLVREGLLIQNAAQPGPDWFDITTEGGQLLHRLARFEKWERLGLDRVKAALQAGSQWYPDIAESEEMRSAAWDWVRKKENKPPVHTVASGQWVVVAESRVAELKALSSPDFDFRKLVRLCEELNIASREDCHLATAMLTRAILDHVPPIFGVEKFSHVSANYAGGSKSFKDSMQHLANGARKIADAHLHEHIRAKESLPTAQQVNFAPQIDVLLGEIVRIHR